jgi:inosine-uridine nucleoside N-ribohydrolase
MLTPRKIIIDTDPGVDDAIAINIALQSPVLEVMGLTTVYGNVHTPVATQNALRILEFSGHGHIPVASGAVKPLIGELAGIGDFVHGADGLGNTNLPDPQGKASDLSAVEFMKKTIMAHPHEITLVAIAPLTNLAQLIITAPEVVPLVKEVVLMGGAIYVRGNVSATAEANIWGDPHAAHAVLTAGWPVTLFGLDVTIKALLRDDYLRSLPARAGGLGRYIQAISGFYRDFYFNHHQISGVVMHDVCPVAYLIDPTLFSFEQGDFNVIADGENRGQTVLDTASHHYKTQAAVAVDDARLLALVDLHLTGQVCKTDRSVIESVV